MPWEYSLWTYLTLQELDRGRAWTERMKRIDAARLSAMAFSQPHLIEQERVQALAYAADRQPAPASRAELLELGLELAAEIEGGGVLE